MKIFYLKNSLLSIRLFLLGTFYFTTVVLNYSNAQKTLGVTKYRQGNDEKGYVLLSPMNGKNTYLIDKCGREIKTWKTNYLAGMLAYLLPDGSLLRGGNIADTNYMTPGKGGILEKYSWDGKLLWSYKISNDSLALHHDFYPMKNGNILAIAWHGIPASEAEAKGRKTGTCFSNKLWSERVLEIKPIGTNDAEIVWQWSLIDHIVQNENILKPDYDVISNHPELVDINYFKNSDPDWIHINSIDYNEEFDQIMLTCHHLNEIWVIDHSTTTSEAASHSGGKRNMGGDLLYRWGNPQVYQMGNNSSQKFFGQHNANWIPKSYKDGGSIMVFNNGLGRYPQFSSVEIFSPTQSSPGVYNSTLPYGPSTQTWIYKDSTPAKFFSMVISGAQRMPNGNTLVCSGVSGKIFEIGSKNNIVWEYINPVITDTILTDGVTPNGNSVFRTFFYPDTFSAFKNKTLKPGNVLEKYPKSLVCNTPPKDTMPPSPVLFTPQNLQANVPPNIIPQIEFNENIIRGVSGNIYIYENNILKATLANTSPDISINSNRLTINPIISFGSSSKISIAMEKNCISDSSNNGIKAIDSSKWVFFIEKNAEINDFDIIRNKSIFPNPASDFINIYLKHPLNKIEILNNLGQKTIYSDFEIRNDIAKIDISNLPQSVYTIIIENTVYGIFIKN